MALLLLRIALHSRRSAASSASTISSPWERDEAPDDADSMPRDPLLKVCLSRTFVGSRSGRVRRDDCADTPACDREKETKISWPRSTLWAGAWPSMWSGRKTQKANAPRKSVRLTSRPHPQKPQHNIHNPSPAPGRSRKRIFIGARSDPLRGLGVLYRPYLRSFLQGGKSVPPGGYFLRAACLRDTRREKRRRQGARRDPTQVAENP